MTEETKKKKEKKKLLPSLLLQSVINFQVLRLLKFIQLLRDRAIFMNATVLFDSQFQVVKISYFFFNCFLYTFQNIQSGRFISCFFPPSKGRILYEQLNEIILIV